MRDSSDLQEIFERIEKLEKRKAETRNKKVNYSILIAVISLILSVSAVLIDYSSLNLSKRELRTKVSEIDQKRTDLIIELLSELKELYFRVDIEIEDQWVNSPFFPQQDMLGTHGSFTEEQLGTRVLFVVGEKDSLIQRIDEISNDPVLPLAIKSKLEFITTKGGKSPEDRANYKARIYFSRIGAKELSSNRRWLVEFGNDCTLKEYLLKYQVLFTEINGWLDKHYDLSDSLNI